MKIKKGVTKMSIIKEYNEALQKLYDHVGFKEDYVTYPIDDNTNMYWYIDNDKEIYYAETIDAEEYYSGTIYTQRFYDKYVYEGKDYTMIFANYHIDGMKYFSFFDNKKKIDKSEIEWNEI